MPQVHHLAGAYSQDALLMQEAAEERNCAMSEKCAACRSELTPKAKRENLPQWQCGMWRDSTGRPWQSDTCRILQLEAEVERLRQQRDDLEWLWDREWDRNNPGIPAPSWPTVVASLRAVDAADAADAAEAAGGKR